jgi:hypothetical protein
VKRKTITAMNTAGQKQPLGREVLWPYRTWQILRRIHVAATP